MYFFDLLTTLLPLLAQLAHLIEQIPLDQPELGLWMWMAMQMAIQTVQYY